MRNLIQLVGYQRRFDEVKWMVEMKTNGDLELSDSRTSCNNNNDDNNCNNNGCNNPTYNIELLRKKKKESSQNQTTSKVQTLALLQRTVFFSFLDFLSNCWEDSKSSPNKAPINDD